MITRSTLRSNRFKSYNHFNKQGDYANIRPSKVKPAPEGDWDDDLDPEDRAVGALTYKGKRNRISGLKGRTILPWPYFNSNKCE